MNKAVSQRISTMKRQKRQLEQCVTKEVRPEKLIFWSLVSDFLFPVDFLVCYNKCSAASLNNYTLMSDRVRREVAQQLDTIAKSCAPQ